MRKHAGFYLSLLFIFIDRIVTTFFFELESNPIIIEIGIIGLWVSAIVLAPIYYYVYFNVYDSAYEVWAKICSYMIFSIYFIVVISNIVFIFFVY